MSLIVVQQRKFDYNLEGTVAFNAAGVAYLPSVEGSRRTYLFLTAGEEVLVQQLPFMFKKMQNKEFGRPATISFKCENAVVMFQPVQVFKDNYADDPDFKRLCDFLWMQREGRIKGGAITAIRAGIEKILP